MAVTEGLLLGWHISAYCVGLRSDCVLLAGPLSSGCKVKAKAKQKLSEKTAQKHAKQFGKALGVSAADLLWGLGSVRYSEHVFSQSPNPHHPLACCMADVSACSSGALALNASLVCC